MSGFRYIVRAERRQALFCRELAAKVLAGRGLRERWGVVCGKEVRSLRGLNCVLVIGAALAGLLYVRSVGAQDYAWPLDAPPAMTSSFGEYRPGHLHAGLDLRTGGEIGREVYAVDHGYVWRVRTSPWGYGAAVYLRLDNGNTAVYGHLSGFAPKIAEVVERAQEECQRYSVDLYPEEGVVRVERAELIGFSGDTGAGPPHLHFELRDAGNRPINPLGHGLTVPDRIPPRITRIAVCPVGPTSWVNGDRQPWILKLHWDERKALYTTEEVPSACGVVRLAAQISDRANGVPNQLGAYRTELYVDGVEAFSAQSDVFCYEDTHHAELDHSFELRSRGLGTFQNLYRAPGNRLPFYGDHETGDGTLCYLASTAGGGTVLSKGRHEIRVVASDLYGNEAAAAVSLLLDAPPELLDFQAEGLAEGTGLGLALHGTFRDQDDTALRLQMKRSLDGGETWEEFLADSVSTEDGPFRFVVEGADVPAALYSASLADSMGATSCLRTCLVPGAGGDGGSPAFRITRKVVHQDFLEMEWETTELLARPPKVEVWSKEQVYAHPTCRQLGLRRYGAAIEFAPERDGTLRVVVSGVAGSGERGQTEVSYHQKTISASSSGQVRSVDGGATAEFPSGAVYAPLCPTVESFRPKVSERLKAVGDGYEFLPSSVPFDKPVGISLRYPKQYPRPQQLGIYRDLGEASWGFVGCIVDTQEEVVRAEVCYFSRYALLADEVPPVISLVIPRPDAQPAESQPLIRARVRDFESGIRREEDIALRLDGKRLISVYDPEAHTVSHQIKRPLAKGPHTLQIVVRDACGNEARSESTFRVK